MIELTYNHNHERRAHHLHADCGDARCLRGALPNIETMNNLPDPHLHTYYDNELGERLYWADEQLAFDGGGRLIVIPERFLSDGFSIPKMWRGFFAKAPRYIMAAFAHDWLYKIQPDKVTRKQADDIFLFWMKAYGVSRIRRTLMYLAVRAASRKVWRVRPPSYANTDHRHD